MHIPGLSITELFLLCTTTRNLVRFAICLIQAQFDLSPLIAGPDGVSKLF